MPQRHVVSRNPIRSRRREDGTETPYARKTEGRAALSPERTVIGPGHRVGRRVRVRARATALPWRARR